MKLEFLRRRSGFLLFTFILSWLGVGRRLPFEMMGPSGLPIGIGLWAGATLLWIGAAFQIYLVRTESPLNLESGRIKIFLGLSGILMLILDLIQWHSFKHLGYRFPSALLLLDLILLSWISFSKMDFSVRVAWSTAVAHRALSILIFPLANERSNMLFAISQGLNLFSQGKSPYGLINEGGVERMPYLPMAWLTHFPSFIFAFDARWMGVLFLAITGWVVERWLVSRRTGEGSYREGSSIMMLWFLNPYLAFRHDLYLDFFWLLCLSSTWFSLQRKILWTAVFSGIAIATSQFAWIIAPFWWLAASTKRKWTDLAKCGFLSLSVAGVFILPFIFLNKSDFWSATFFYLSSSAKTFPRELCLSLSPLFYSLCWERLLTPMQLILPFSLGIYGIYLWKSGKGSSGKAKTPQVILRVGVIAYFLFIIFSHFSENYFYLAPLLILCTVETVEAKATR